MYVQEKTVDVGFCIFCGFRHPWEVLEHVPLMNKWGEDSCSINPINCSMIPKPFCGMKNLSGIILIKSP